MAEGDQWHFMGSASNTAVRPSSGVEVVLKVAATYVTSWANYSYAYYRTAASTNGGYAVVGGAYYGNQQIWDARPSMTKHDHAATGAQIMSNASIPINYTHYIWTITSGTGAYQFSGYITKD